MWMKWYVQLTMFVVGFGAIVWLGDAINTSASLIK